MVRGKNLKLPLADVLARARAVVDTGAYTLEQGLNGGNDPEAPWPYNRPMNGRPFPDGTADCVGVGAWIQGLDRYQPQLAYYGGWMNTNSVFHMPELFDNLGQNFAEVQPGDALVYPSYLNFLGRKRYGHWMTVTSVMYKGRRATKLSELTGVHCSQRKAPATRETYLFAKGPSKAWAFFRPVWRRVSLFGDGQ